MVRYFCFESYVVRRVMIQYDIILLNHLYDVKAKRSGLKVRSVGFVGYNSIKTKKYPKGQPNRLIAASVNSGSSVRQKDPFVRRAQQGTRAKCVQEMQDTVDAEIEKYTK